MGVAVTTAYPHGVTATGTAPQFASELRRWRQSRRISQLELALRAGTTQRHVSYVEQGRSRPGRTMVLRLAESLELSLRERNALLLAAGYAPVFAESQLDDDALSPVRDALDRILVGHMPYPAVVVATGGQLVAANAATDVLTAGAAPELLEPPVNVLRLVVHPDGMGPRVENLAEWAGTSSRTSAPTNFATPIQGARSFSPTSSGTSPRLRRGSITSASRSPCACDAKRVSCS